MEKETLQAQLSFLFFSFAVLFSLLACLVALIHMSKWWRWQWCCSCSICEAYVTASWVSEHRNLSDWYTHLLRSSPTGTIHIHVLRNTITANPANVEYMLKTNFNNYPKGKPFSAILGDFLGQGIFNVDGDHWMFQRKLAAAEMASPVFRAFAMKIVSSEVIERLLPLLHSAATEKQQLDLQDVFRRFSFDCICKISFGMDPGCLDLSMPMPEFVAAFDRASMLSAQRAAAPAPVVWRLKRLFNVGEEKELRDAIRMIDLLAEAVIRQRRKLGVSSSNDLLSRFMSSIENDRYLRDIIVSFMLAGRDTISSALTGFFLLLLHNPHVKSSIRHEIDAAFSSAKNGNASLDRIREMHYVHAALYESMRLLPPVQFDSKFCNGDDTLPDGANVTKGTRVTYHSYAMGRMEDVWGPDCNEFRPERWLNNGRFVPVSPFKYPVFQGGIRVCVGKEMALMEMKTVIVTILRSFDFESVRETSGSPKFAPGLTATFAGGLPVRVHKRDHVK
ncbi:Cytochrome P450 [Rhynchospora pubera]|uniref:Cytochrome P450 n=1 Tax=Rhynchospora pubera TaxID=906938 RepID=A0AAV8CV13_9POAL|nr:Cytochrome P450 [Rhynchospora pubera]